MIKFGEKVKLQQCQDVEKIIQQFGIETTLEWIDKSEKYLYVTASTDTLLRLADEAELTKLTTTGSMQKFNYHSIYDYILPGMTKHDIVRFCEAPVLIKDVIKPELLSHIRNGVIEDMFPLHDIVSKRIVKVSLVKSDICTKKPSHFVLIVFVL